MGLAGFTHGGSYCAAVAEVTITNAIIMRSNGITIGVDCGRVVNPLGAEKSVIGQDRSEPDRIVLWRSPDRETEEQFIQISIENKLPSNR